MVTTPRAPTATPAPIAVIDIRGDGVGGELAQELAVALGKQAGVTSIADPAIAAALVGPIVEEDTRAIADASRALQASRDELARFERASAVAQAALGQRLLFDTAPSPATTALLADLAFAEGVAELSEPSDRERAGAAFALVHRLVPGRTLDPARYLPEIVTAFAAAAAAPAGRATLAITGDGTLWLDGRAVGPSPGHRQRRPGQSRGDRVGPGRLARGARISVPVDGLAQINLPAAPASRRVQTVRGPARANQRPRRRDAGHRHGRPGPPHRRHRRRAGHPRRARRAGDPAVAQPGAGLRPGPHRAARTGAGQGV